MHVWIVSTYDETVDVFDNEEAALLCQSDEPDRFFVERREVRATWTPGDWERSFQDGPLP